MLSFFYNFLNSLANLNYTLQYLLLGQFKNDIAEIYYLYQEIESLKQKLNNLQQTIDKIENLSYDNQDEISELYDLFSKI